MKLCDMQEVTLCDHNSLHDFKIYESIHFLLYLLNDLKKMLSLMRSVTRP